MKNNADIQSSGSALCILVDGMGKPLHMQIIGNSSVQFHDLCRDEAANALLKHSTEVLAYKIHRFNIINGNFIPDKEPVISKNDLDKLLGKSISNENGVKYFYTSPLRDYIDELIRAVPQKYLWNHYGISSAGTQNIDYVENCCVENHQLTWDVLKFNDYREHNLIETPKGGWLFDNTTAGYKEMIRFSNFLDNYFFDPRLNIDKITQFSAWIHSSHQPENLNHFVPGAVLSAELFPKSEINPQDYFIREHITEYNFQPTPENYWLAFIKNWSEVAVPSVSNNIATLLFIEQNGDAPEDCLNLFLRSEFAEKYSEFCAEITYMRNVKDEPDNLEKLKTMATQIIAENGFVIRGREQPHQLSVQSTQQPTDSFQPKMRGGVHI